MPRNSRTSQFKRTPFFLVILLVKFFLVKLGNFPFSILAFILNKSGRRARKRFHIHFKRIPIRSKISFVFGVIILFFLVYTFFLFKTASFLPSPIKLVASERPLTTEIYDRNGKLLYRLYEGRNRILVKLDELPQSLIDATIAIEDKNFYSHPGIDIFAIARAIKNNLSTNDLQGGSTITQQLIKNTILTPEKTYTRKIKELILAFWAERIYSKEEILQMYFNEAPYGGPAWGIEAASLTYFGKSAKDLNLVESAYLAGLPASPTKFSPYGANLHLSKLRQTQVLDRMVEEGYITTEKASEAKSSPLEIRPPTNEILAPHFVMYVKDYLSQKYGPRVVSQGGLKIHTSLDLGLQEQIQEIVKDEVLSIRHLNVQNGAAIVTDAKTGQILAMVGSKDYYEPQFGNYNATLALRQPGSSIKPITYATAFKQGLTPATIVLDIPVTFPDGSNRPYSPVNYDGRFHGPVSVRTALGSSYNIPAVKVLATVEVNNMIQTAKDLGITTLNDPRRYGLSLTLGGGEVKMIEMMGVYGAFSQNGSFLKPTPILKVTDSNGNIIESFESASQQSLQPEIAYLITHILADNTARTPAFGPSSLLNIPGHQVAVKTGTSDNKRDNWTFGFTPEFVVGVWVGNNDNTPMNPALTSGITGAAPIWNKIMKGLLATREPVAFKRPPGVIDVFVYGKKDLAVAGILPRSLVRISQKDNQTTYFDSYSAYATTSATARLPHGIAN